MIARADVIAEARRWLDTPWLHQARLRGVGVDCIGLIAGVAREVKCQDADVFFATPGYHSYGREPSVAMMFAGCEHLMQRIEIDAIDVADVLLIAFEGFPMHFAFLSQRAPDRIIHAWATARKVVEHELDETWRGRIVRAYRLRGVV